MYHFDTRKHDLISLMPHDLHRIDQVIPARRLGPMGQRSLILVVAALGLASDGDKGGKPVTDQERIQGTWRLVSGERQGRALPDEAVRDVSLTFAGDRLSTRRK